MITGAKHVQGYTVLLLQTTFLGGGNRYRVHKNYEATAIKTAVSKPYCEKGKNDFCIEFRANTNTTPIIFTL